MEASNFIEHNQKSTEKTIKY